jgi:hypothetical protein
MTAYLADPLTIACPYIYCTAGPGQRCTKYVSWSPIGPPPAARPHKARVRLALVLAAHSDPALDAFFPRAGGCGLCGTPGLDQRHRVIDAIAEHLECGETPEDVAGEFGVSAEAAEAVAAWAARWPGVLE